jgi:hypothetical protein
MIMLHSQSRIRWQCNGKPGPGSEVVISAAGEKEPKPSSMQGFDLGWDLRVSSLPRHVR